MEVQTRHPGDCQVVWYVVGLVRPAKTAPKKEKGAYHTHEDLAVYHWRKVGMSSTIQTLNPEFGSLEPSSGVGDILCFPFCSVMERTKKSSTKRHKKVSDTPPIDRLSALPDGVLCHILSFLPTKLSVSTNALAKRWRPLWAHVRSLRFEGEISSDVIHRVMLHHKAKSIDTFSLYHVSHCNEFQLDTWITTAIERNIQLLDLVHATVMLPRHIFTCKTLVDLRLSDCTGIPSSTNIYLPSLKRLSLRRVKYEVEEDLPRLLSGCPLLDVLTIVSGNMNRDLGCFNISSPSIKRLNVIFSFYSPNSEVRVVINAPALRYLKVFTCYYEHMSLSPMTSLVEADLNLNGVQEHFYCILSIRELFDCFPNVKRLKLSGCCKFPEAEVAGSIVKFDNLTKLELGVDWHLINRFLETADNLEDLIICEVSKDKRNWMESVEDRLLQSLRTITINGFGCTERELNMVKYILRNAQVLKRMEIYSGRFAVASKKMVDTLKRILLFHRVSKECEVAFD
ncbi:putative fbd-associated F-box protein at5g56440 [Phtheirospermum japonicum]|uniref:Putative fbd-associated F-box protein at5g56440 n=1 Tax=Phtheirospermum japonicum TaxID=374723 RepID=A0A830CEE6_9LAMI|nr:putative fbd-associated F-box protein at5g56440 [Phtheirospermum japonicum]